MDIRRIGSQPSTKGSAEYFTGTARMGPLFQTSDPARVFGANVIFEPCARTAWHTHPLEAAGFDVLVTTDRNIRYQQNLTGRKIAIVVLDNPVDRSISEISGTREVSKASPSVGSWDLMLICGQIPSYCSGGL